MKSRRARWPQSLGRGRYGEAGHGPALVRRKDSSIADGKTVHGVGSILFLFRSYLWTHLDLTSDRW